MTPSRSTPRRPTPPPPTGGVPPDVPSALPIDELERVARAAGDAAATLFGRVQAERKRDGSIVTEADRTSQRLIVRALRALEPDPRRLYVLAEEETDGEDPNRGCDDPLAADVVAAIDPVDGTTAFASGIPLWSVSIGLVRGGRPVAGVIQTPLVGPRGWLYRVAPDGPAERDGTPLAVAAFDGWTANSQVLVTSGARNFVPIAGFRGKLRSLGSTAHHLALVAAGAADAAILGRPWAWDLAAGQALVERAGGVLETLDGAAPDWPTMLRRRRQPAPLLVGSPAAVAALRSLLGAV